ncbi:hypothetical protein DSO57_1020243 [Entomophthora muscae]|uniref:Uncharacterized protein n=1 Tax=Entomophthora muscae TaxID=34485 RepID=A0ACC2TEJ2_9FUNG|nr:hypothetical protein DSO57_1020243 [Entomophthora muscae]
MVPNSGPWSLLGRSVSYVIKLAPILWWALPTGPAVPRPESPNVSIYAWLPDNQSPLWQLFQEGAFEHILILVMVRVLFEPSPAKRGAAPVTCRVISLAQSCWG